MDFFAAAAQHCGKQPCIFWIKIAPGRPDASDRAEILTFAGKLHKRLQKQTLYIPDYRSQEMIPWERIIHRLEPMGNRQNFKGKTDHRNFKMQWLWKMQ